MTDLAGVFEHIASETTSEQHRLRLVAQSREHAQPLIAILEKIRATATGPEGESFSVIEYSTMGGSVVFSAGLKEAGQAGDDNADMHWQGFTAGKDTRHLKLFVNADGTASAVRWDQMVENRGFPDGVAPTQTQAKSAAEIAPVLASWVHAHMPQTAKILTTPPRRIVVHGMAE